MLRFALLGLGVGALYALASQGLIVVYRGSGVLNFALGAMGMVGAYLQWELHNEHGWAFVPSAIVGVAFSAVVGALTYVLIMRPLRRVSPLVRVIATLGVLTTLQAIAVLRFGTTPKFVPSELSTKVLTIHKSITISEDRLILLAIAVGLTLALWLLYKRSRFGVATTAVAENERVASALGWSPDRIAAVNWALGSAIAGFAAILIAPIVTLQVTVMTSLILAATAAALVAGFRSFPLALVAGLAIGIGQTVLTRYVHQQGFGESVPFLVIIIMLVFRGQAIPLRDHFLQRLPSVGSGKVNPRVLIPGVVAAGVVISLLDSAWLDSVNVTIAYGVILLSIVVVTGYAGQLSLAQFAIAGFGAWIAGRLVATTDIGFLPGMLIAMVATIPVGVLFALPAVRTRGINLAIVTLGLGVAIELMIFRNTAYTGNFQGTRVGEPTLFGFNIDAIGHPARYAFFGLFVFLVCALVLANVRRGASGRKLIAVRTNERAAAALGIGVPWAKLYAFGLSAGIAALGGVLLAFRLETIDYSTFTSFISILLVGLALIGGLGYLFGAMLGATLAAGAFGQQILDEIFGAGVGKYIGLISGLSILALVLLNPDGVARAQIDQIAFLRDRLAGRLPWLRRRRPERAPLPEASREAVEPATLEVRGMKVAYGRTVAVDDVSLDVRPGQITGLIGPNGAGKTTLIDAVTGFTPMRAGTISLDGEAVTKWNVAKRARHGIARSFQSLELFEDSTVLENLRVASDPESVGSYFRDLVWPKNPPLAGEVVSAIKEFGLEEDLDRQVSDLPYGKRRLLAIARAVAMRPRILLLDEPAAGLGGVETEELAHLVKRLAADWGMGILLVEHDVNFVMTVCDFIVVLDFGREISRGAPATVRNDPAVIASYLGEDTEATTPPGGVVASAGGGDQA
ncbi:MAG TPA: branched-chain amino acid ABC transporter permease/ATP-binding protein [Solirubrobacterales bacterium]|nr:branched-chain amino acid ABC transporter permease/ATP-binding protein [Solirubrobacterales bacterium]